MTAIPYPAVMSANNGMTLWLDGADPNVLLGSSRLHRRPRRHSDRVLEGQERAAANNFIQATAANQPGVRRWNGLSAANFADTSDVLNSVNASGNYLTVFVAANVTNSAAR